MQEVDSIRKTILEGGKLPSVAGERRVEQSLFFSACRRHPKSAPLNEAILSAWATEFAHFGDAWGVDIGKLRAFDTASLAAYFWPNSAEDKRTSTLIKLMHWFTLVDDAFGDLDNGVAAHRFCNQLIHNTFEPGLSGPSRMVRAAPGHIHEKQLLITAVGLEWWREMKQSISPTQGARFEHEFCEYLRQQAHEVVFRTRFLHSSKLPEVDDYILMRRASSGLSVCVTMVEYDVGIELDEEKLQNSQLRQLQEGITDFTCWINDILSFPKELAHGELLNLLPLLHMRNNDALPITGEKSTVRFEEAMSQAWQMTQEREKECAALANALQRKYSSPSFHRYVETVCGIACGIWAWTLQSSRYKVLPAGNRSSASSTLRAASPCGIAYSLPSQCRSGPSINASPNYGKVHRRSHHIAGFRPHKRILLPRHRHFVYCAALLGEGQRWLSQCLDKGLRP